MGLFRAFTPKTVSFRYRTLLNLFKRTHSSFTITKEEKNIVEFTLGYKGSFLLYGSIEQYFDSKEFNMGNYKYDFSKVVTISLHMDLDETIVKVEKNFRESEDQTDMYNIVMSSVFAETQKVGTKVVDNEGDNLEKKLSTEEGNQAETKSNIVFIKKWKLIEFVKQFEKIQVGTFKPKDLNKNEFKALVFTKENGEETYAQFFPNSEALTPQEIANRKNELYIGKTKKNTYVLFSEDNEGWEYNPLTESSMNGDEKEIFMNQTLTEAQRALLAIFLNKFTDGEDFHACREIFGIDLNSSVFRYWLNYYKGMYHYSNFGLDRKEYDKKMYNILSTVRNIYAIHAFISSCCSYSYFLYTEDYIKDFTNILICWDFTEEEIHNIINRARKVKYNEYKNYTDLLSFQDFVKIHGSVIKTTKAVNNQTGELFYLYTFINYKNVYTYVASCPYLGNLTLDEIKEKEVDLYVRYGKEGCFYLCTKKSELDRIKYIDRGLEYYEVSQDSDLDYLLTQLNISPESDAFTVEFTDELKLQ